MIEHAVRVPSAMSSPVPPNPRKSYGDPWQAFGYLVAGVLFYGFLGWLADRWLGTGFLVVVGIFIGAGLGVYMTFGRFGGRGQHDDPRTDTNGKEPQE